MAESEEVEISGDFCNVLGQPVEVVHSNLTDFYVNLNDYTKTGFSVYKKDAFTPSMVDKNQIIKEFQLHMLSVGYNFCLESTKNNIDEEKVTQTIENVKRKLLENNSNNSRKSTNQNNYYEQNDTNNRNPRMQSSSFSSSDSVGAFIQIMEAGENLQRTILEFGSIYDVIICHLVKGKTNICFVHLQNSILALAEMMSKIQEIESNLKTLQNPQVSDLVLALFEGAWHRAKVLRIDPLMVHFLDYGNRAKPEGQLKVMPDEFKKLPAFAARVIVHHFERDLECDMELRIKIRYEYQDHSYVCNVITDDAKTEESTEPEKPLEELTLTEHSRNGEFIGFPAGSLQLSNGDTVKIYDREYKTLFLRTKQSLNNTNAIYKYITEMDQIPLQNVKSQQLVLSPKEGATGLVRAIVIEKTSNVIVTVKFLDYPGTDRVTVKSLRNVDEYLAGQPGNSLTVDFEFLKNLENDELIKDKMATVVMENGRIMDLRLKSSGELLSEVVKHF